MNRPVQPTEPLAWIYTRRQADGKHSFVTLQASRSGPLDGKKWTETPLYAHPPALSEEFIQEAMRLHDEAARAKSSWDEANYGNQSSRTNFLMAELQKRKQKFENTRAALEAHLRSKAGPSRE